MNLTVIRETVEKRKGTRNWSALPNGFEVDAVKAVFQDIKGLLPSACIKERINLSKAQTFAEVETLISKIENK